jgi:hypothetical protein
MDEARQIALVEVLEAMHFVLRGDGVADAGHDVGGQLEAQVHVRGTDVE